MQFTLHTAILNPSARVKYSLWSWRYLLGTHDLTFCRWGEMRPIAARSRIYYIDMTDNETANVIDLATNLVNFRVTGFS